MLFDGSNAVAANPIAATATIMIAAIVSFMSSPRNAQSVLLDCYANRAQPIRLCHQQLSTPFHLVIDLSLSTSSDASIARSVLYSFNYSLARAHSIRVLGIYAAMTKITLYTDPYMGCTACYLSWYERSHRTGEHADSDAII